MKSRKQAWLTISFWIFTLAVAASFPATAQAEEREFIYTANFADNTISGFSFDPANGKVAELSGSPFSSGVGPTSVAHSPDGRFLYVAISSQFLGSPCGINPAELLSYSIDPRTGALTLLDDAILPNFCSTDVITDPTGKFVYDASIDFNDPKVGAIDAFKSSEGHLLPLPGSPFESPIEVSPGQNPAIEFLAITPNGKVLYASNPNDSRGILIFDRNTRTGALRFRTAFNTGAAFTPIAITPSGRFLIALGDVFLGNGRPGLFEFEIGERGDLTPVPGSPFPVPGGFGIALDVSPRGDLVAIVGVGGVITFRESEHGRPSLVPGSPFGGDGAFAVTFDPSGRFVLVPGTVFRIHPATGALTKVSDFTPGGFVESITVVRTCEASDEDRDDKHDGDRHDGDRKHDAGCHERSEDQRD